MEKKDGSSLKRGTVVKVIPFTSERTAVAGGKLPPANKALVEAEMNHYRRCYEAAAKQGYFHPVTGESLYEIMLRKNQGTPWQRKREARLNTCAGLPAKRRSFVKSLKRLYRKRGLKCRNAHVVETLWVSSQMYPGSVTSYLRDLFQNFDYGNSISGSAVPLVMDDGIKDHDWKIQTSGIRFTPPNSSSVFII